MTTYTIQDLASSKGTSEPVRQALLALSDRVDTLTAERDACFKAEKENFARWREVVAERDALQSRVAELEKDAARYRWLRDNVSPVMARPKQNYEFPDYNAKWQIRKYLVAITAVAGDVSFDESVDMAMKETT